MDFFKASWLRPAPDPEVQERILDLIREVNKTSGERPVLELVNALVEKGQSVNFLEKYGSLTPLHLAAKKGLTKIVMLLVSAHADIDRKDSIGFSAMHYAIMEGHRETVKCLCDLGASIQASLNGRSALHLAFYYGRQDVAEYLLDISMRLNSKDDRCRTPIALASFRYQMSEAWIMEKMIYHLGLNRSKGSEFLVCAAEAGCEDIVRYLVKEQGVDVNTTRTNGETALMAACQCHHTHEEDYKRMVKLLLRRSIHVDTQDMKGNTALHFASGNGAPKLVEILLRSGASPDLSNKNKETPLYLAKKFGWEDTKNILIQYGAVDAGRGY